MYQRYFSEFRTEVHTLLLCFLFWRMIRDRASTDEILLKAFNQTPLSWGIVRHSLSVNMFLTLGRIFDIDSDAFSVDELLKCCIEEISIFSRAEMRHRLSAVSKAGKTESLNKFLDRIYEPSKTDFQRLRGEVSKHRKTFDSIYRPIRHKVLAHKEKCILGREDELWSRTSIDQVKEIIWFLYDLEDSLFQCYHNGKKPELTGKEPDTEYYEKDFSSLLDLVKKNSI